MLKNAIYPMKTIYLFSFTRFENFRWQEDIAVTITDSTVGNIHEYTYIYAIIKCIIKTRSAQTTQNDAVRISLHTFI